MSAFSAVKPEFDAFLESAKNVAALVPGRAGDARNPRFIPRNFLIDERIDSGRAINYAADLPIDALVSFNEWNEAHNHYLAQHVFRKPPVGHDHQAVDTDDPNVCPETFRPPLALAAFQGTDFDTDFIRMMAVADLAWLSGRAEAEIFALGERVVQDSSATNPARADLEMIFEEAFHGPKCDHRPVFATFYEDFLDELRNPAGTTWPDQLRDRLGLYHINQWVGPLPRRVFLFRYSVREIPCRQGEADRRPIALPTVLDHRLAEAFCPAPKGLRQGQLLNLRENSVQQPAREVLHLFMPLEPRHLFRTGTVTTPVPDFLGRARRDHLLWLRLLSEREDYAAATDNDLL